MSHKGNFLIFTFRLNFGESFFIKALCEVLENSCRRTFDELVLRVNEKMSKLPPVEMNGNFYYLAPYYEGCLTKRLRFELLQWPL